MGDELPVAGPAAHGHRLKRLGDGADLVELDQRGVRDAPADGIGDDGRVRAEIVVTDEFHHPAQAGGEGDPALVIILAKPVLDEMNGKPGGDGGQPFDQVAAAEQFAGHPVLAVRLAEFRGGEIQGDGDPVRARPVTRVADGLHQQPQHIFGLGYLRERSHLRRPGRWTASAR